MKKLKPIAAGCLLLFFASSCTVTYHSVTNNPIGESEGESGGVAFFNPDLDFSYHNAAKRGSINKISTTKFRVTNYLFVPYYQTTVTGTQD